MLKYFGLKEIMYGIKKFAVWIVIVTVLLAGAGAVSAYAESNGTSEEVADNYYSSSRTYVLTAEETSNIISSQADLDRKCADTAVAMLKADFTKQFIYGKLLEPYTEDEILQYAVDAESNLGFNVLTESLKANVLSESSVVNFFCEAKNKEFAEKAVGYWEEYFLETIVKQIPYLKDFKCVGGTTVELPNEGDGFAIDVPSVAGRTMIFAILGFVLSICAVMAYVLFNPAIASKKDFESYGVTILDTVKEHGDSGVDFAAEAIKQKVLCLNCDAVTVTSSINSKKVAVWKNEFIKRLNSIETEKAVSFSESNNIVKDYSSFAEAKQNDGAVLIEIKGKSCHRDFKRTVSLLKKYDVNIIGVVLI